MKLAAWRNKGSVGTSGEKGVMWEREEKEGAPRDEEAARERA
jgi:hypothetical protein